MINKEFNDYIQKKQTELRDLETRTFGHLDFANKLRINYNYLMRRSDSDNRLSIWNNESDGNSNGTPRYMQDPVYQTLYEFRREGINKFALEPKDIHENRIAYSANVFISRLLESIKQRTVTESGYTPFLGLSYQELKDKIGDETQEFYFEGLKSLGFITRHSSDGRARASEYSIDKMSEKYFGGKKQ